MSGRKEAVGGEGHGRVRGEGKLREGYEGCGRRKCG